MKSISGGNSVASWSLNQRSNGASEAANPRLPATGSAPSRYTQRIEPCGVSCSVIASTVWLRCVTRGGHLVTACLQGLAHEPSTRVLDPREQRRAEREPSASRRHVWVGPHAERLGRRSLRRCGHLDPVHLVHEAGELLIERELRCSHLPQRLGRRDLGFEIRHVSTDPWPGTVRRWMTSEQGAGTETPRGDGRRSSPEGVAGGGRPSG